MKTLVDREDLIFSPPQLGCVLCLPGLPGGGSKIYDRSPYGNHGTITGATWKKLPSGLWYLSFDGTDDVVDFGKAIIPTTTGDFTLYAWLKTTSSIGMAQYSGGAGRTAYQIANHQLQLRVGDNAISSTTSVDDGEWHQGVFARESSDVTVYIDGFVEGSPVTVADAITDQNFKLGLIGDAYKTGSLALVRIYNRALSALELNNHFNREKHLFGVWSR